MWPYTNLCNIYIVRIVVQFPNHHGRPTAPSRALVGLAAVRSLGRFWPPTTVPSARAPARTSSTQRRGFKYRLGMPVSPVRPCYRPAGQGQLAETTRPSARSLHVNETTGRAGPRLITMHHPRHGLAMHRPGRMVVSSCIARAVVTLRRRFDRTNAWMLAGQAESSGSRSMHTGSHLVVSFCLATCNNAYWKHQGCS